MADSRIAAVLAADDRFSRPLAATVRSIVSQLSPAWAPSNVRNSKNTPSS